MFISFEGIDGSGKTTVSRIVFDALRDRGNRVVLTKEPTDGIVWTEELRRGRDPESGFSLFFRFTEDRYAHQKFISRHLENGDIVLCDRYLLSSFAYQGAIIESAFPDREKLVSWMMNTSSIITVRPDITFYLDIDPKVSMERLKSRESLTGFEEKTYLDRVRDIYRYVDFPGKITVDASKEKEEVISEILEKIENVITQ